MLITQSDLLDRQWSRAAIPKLLGEPDQLKRNPKYACAAPMKLYQLERVEQVEGESTLWQRNAKRVEAAKRSAQVRFDALIERANTVPIKIANIGGGVVGRAIKAYNDYYSYDDRNKYAYRNSDPEFLYRITLNYIRHELTTYDDFLSAIWGQPGVQEAHDIIKRRINNLAIEMYQDQLAKLT